MKVNGLDITKPRIVNVYLPIADGEAVEFSFRALRADEDFEKVLSKPAPPVVVKPGGVRHHNTEDKRYKAAIQDWFSKKIDWEFLKAISVTKELTWDTVKLEDPNTWGNWRTEMEAIFGSSEISKVFNGFLEAQYISEEVMEKARERFLTGTRERLEMSLSQTDEQVGTQSGEAVNG